MKAGPVLLLGLLVGCSYSQPGDKCNNGRFDFNMVTADNNFQPKQILGLWYQTRWYLPQKSTVSDAMWDLSVYLFTKPGQNNKIFCWMNHRPKGSNACADEVEDTLTQVEKGVYFVNEEDKFAENVTITYVHVDPNNFMLEILCHSPDNGQCQDITVTFMSRTPYIRKQDKAKGVMILNRYCYGHMKRFLDTKHEIECTPPLWKKCKCPSNCPWKRKRRGRGGYQDDDDDDEGCRARRMRRRRRDRDDDDDDDDDDRWGKQRMSRRGRDRDDDDDDDDDDDRWGNQGMRGRRRDDDDDDRWGKQRMSRRRRDRDDDDDDDDRRGNRGMRGRRRDDDDYGRRRRRMMGRRMRKSSCGDEDDRESRRRW